jgi:magnesium-transporting ATPase (P-type)
LRVEEVFAALDTLPTGLSPDSACQRLALNGPNSLREPPRPPSWRKFIGQVTHLMALLLWLAGGLMLWTQPLLGLVIWGVVLLNGAFSFWQEYQAERAIAGLKAILPSFARVLRNGNEVKIPTHEIVPGDVLVLAEGDNIPADARLVEAFGLRVNNATLTGEALPARKMADASLRDGLTEVERPNLIFAGTSVVSGTARAVVFATGMTTQFGRIAQLTQAVPDEPSQLQKSLKKATRRLSWLALGLGLLLFLHSLFDLNLSFTQAFALAIGAAVAILPEGLLPTITLSLAAAVRRLAQQGVLVTKLSTVETLGATSVICTDKSGTLTQNQMTVRALWVGGQHLNVSGVGYDPVGKFEPALKGASTIDLESLLTAALACNNARLNPPSEDRPQWTCLGDQTEAALRALAYKGGLIEERALAQLPRKHELPFDARRKRMSAIHRIDSTEKEVAFIKGAPREVLQLCDSVLMNGCVRPLDAATRTTIMAANDDYARSALRVLALARRDLPTRTGAYTPESVERGLTFLGLAAMMDPPRPEVAAAVRTLREAGIRLVMITGDYGLTAESLARRVGLITSSSPRILTGAELDELSDSDLDTLLKDEIICARMAPEHKLRLVAAFQARGEVVAVSGDGVNDAPALRKADVGIAMGITGSDVAKEAADVILTNDSFAAIVSAIREGRAVYDNIRKFMTYIFASNIPELAPFLMTGLLGLPLAVNVAQLLAIDLGADILPALALGPDRPEPNVMRRPPRGRQAALLSQTLLNRALWLGLIETLLCYAGFFYIYYQAGYSNPLTWPAEGVIQQLASTVYFAGVLMAQVGSVLTCRTEVDRVHEMGWASNSLLLGGVGLSVGLGLVLIYVQPLAVIFLHEPIMLSSWLWLPSFAIIVYGLDRIRKSLLRHWTGIIGNVRLHRMQNS